MLPLILSDDGNDDVASTSSQTVTDPVLSTLPRRPKRARTNQDLRDSEASDTETDDDRNAAHDGRDRTSKALRRSISYVAIPGTAFTRSAFAGWEPPLPRSTEAAAIADLQTAFDAVYDNAVEPPDHTCFVLNDFSIYRPKTSRHADELVSLDRLIKADTTGFLFDGVLSFGDKKHFLQAVKFSILTVEGYGDPNVTSLRDRLCIQSPTAGTKQVWFQLGRPEESYKRFYEPFVWLAEFTKYFLDYLLETDQVTLQHFRLRFSQWLRNKCGTNPDCQDWLVQCNHRIDFRNTVAAYFSFLWKECCGINGGDIRAPMCQQPIWGEINPFDLKAIPRQPNRVEKTVVTPFVYDCFKHVYFHEHMEVREVTDRKTMDEISRRKEKLGLTPFGASQAPEASILTPQSLSHVGDNLIDVRVGDVVCVPPETDGAWRATSSTWFAYVQQIRHLKSRTLLDAIWLYEPHDTPFGKAYSPFTNELFMSDNCNCGSEAIDLAQVTGKVDVNWFATDPSQHSGLFVRHTFRTVEEEDTYDFVSLQQSDFHCNCTKKVPLFQECLSKYKVGDAVLVRQWKSDLKEDCLEPAQIVNFQFDKKRIILRRLTRKSDLDASAAPNELVLSDQTFDKPPSAIIRKFHVRFFTEAQVLQGLPTPYDRNGAGDFFYIVKHTASNDMEVDIDDTNDNMEDGFIQASTRVADSSGVSFPELEQGPHFELPDGIKKLTGMGIFCGGGNFDRGIEDGGAVNFRYAVDWADRAIHSYRANVSNPEEVQFWLGSVNDYLASRMAGTDSKLVARVGDACVICAGSPCPGFSLMQPNMQSFDSLRNASMVASVLSFVDVYCPEYLILENVTSMTYGLGPTKSENVFAQIVACLVAMGYQVQQFLMDAWNYSSCQSRSRVFIIASAPGLKPFPQPQHTHAHPEDTARKSLGKSTNGKPFGMRRFDCTAFQHVTPSQATADLPAIGDSQPQLCPAHPDHRAPSEETAKVRARIAAVPVRPFGMGLPQAARAGLLSGEPLEWYEQQKGVKKAQQSKSYSRVNPNGLFRTVTTSLNLQDGKNGTTLHWSEHRSLTVMETKRAQGFRDADVIVGTPRDQIKIIGNSVDRSVALMLGLALRESWTTSDRYVNSRNIAPTSPRSSSHSAVASQPSTPVSNFTGREDQSAEKGRLTLSQKEIMEIR